MSEKESIGPLFVNAAGRSEAVPLDWPIEHDGKRWDHITVRRLTAAELAAWVEQARTADTAADVPLPMVDAPLEVMNALDADDDERVREVMERFLPHRFRAAANAPTPAPGEPSPPA